MALTGEYAGQPRGLGARRRPRRSSRPGRPTSVDIKGRPVVLVTIRGAKSGKLRYMPLMRVEHDGRYAIVASKGGAPEHPVWYPNLVANPHVELQDGTVTKEYDAREVTGDERRAVVGAGGRGLPADYADYQQKTDRLIPVFVLEPREG